MVVSGHKVKINFYNYRIQILKCTGEGGKLIHALTMVSEF